MLGSLDEAIAFARAAEGESTALLVVDWRELIAHFDRERLWDPQRLDAWLRETADPSLVFAPLLRVRFASAALLRDRQAADLDTLDRLHQRALLTDRRLDAATLQAIARDECPTLAPFAIDGARAVALHRPRRAAPYAVTLVLPSLDDTEQQLRRSEARYRGIVEDQTDFIVRYRADGVRTFVNDVYASFFGGEPKDFVGTSFLPNVAPEDRAGVLEKHQRLLAGEADALADEHRSIRHDGVECWTHWIDRAIRDERGDVVEFQAVGRDLTARKDAERRLAQAQKMEAIGTMAGGLAHDFNNTLSCIIGLAELIVQRPEQRGTVLQCAEAILEATQRATQLTLSLLRLSRRPPLRLAPCNLREVLDAAARLLRVMVPARIALHVAAPELPPLQADAGQLTQALINLGLNARDAIADGGSIELSAALDERDGQEMIVLRVTDDGAGIPDHVRPHLFEPFFTTKPDGHGTGLGLAMVYACAIAHGGRVEFDSELGRGSSFEIRLPASPRATSP
ncbi:MAG TPA: ATP-binding protein [Enhygromyxa sp.]|nr:ATP-binding protein [Enhygromyxa sp.]